VDVRDGADSLVVHGQALTLPDRDVLDLVDQLEPLAGLDRGSILVGRQLRESEVGPEEDELVDIVGPSFVTSKATSPASTEAGSSEIANSSSATSTVPPPPPRAEPTSANAKPIGMTSSRYSRRSIVPTPPVAAETPPDRTPLRLIPRLIAIRARPSPYADAVSERTKKRAEIPPPSLP
jgi:hypothetical protein